MKISGSTDYDNSSLANSDIQFLKGSIYFFHLVHGFRSRQCKYTKVEIMHILYVHMWEGHLVHFHVKTAIKFKLFIFNVL